MTIPLSQAETESAWLQLSYAVASARDCTCVCRPVASGQRWTGYLGANYVDPSRPFRRVLFLGANHNPKKLWKGGYMSTYQQQLREWVQRADSRDASLLPSMRIAYDCANAYWKPGVWTVFANIRKELHLSLTETAFCNLARCPNPDGIVDDVAIPACQASFAAAALVEAIDARVVFVAKRGVGDDVDIPGEIDGTRLVIRYDNSSFGAREGLRYDKWIPKAAPSILAFINQV